jgi:hypothetical protein
MASTVGLSAVNSGYYNLYGTPDGSANNIAIYGDTVRDWIGFDLSSISGTITSATLQISSDSRNASGQTINWWDVTSSYGTLGAANGAAGVSIFKDLGTGTLFSSGIQTAGTLNSFTLNSDALASLNASHSLWAIGGQETSASYAFGYQNGVSSSQTIRLILDVQSDVQTFSILADTRPGDAVPETGSSFALLAAGLGGLMAFRVLNSAPKRVAVKA